MQTSHCINRVTFTLHFTLSLKAYLLPMWIHLEMVGAVEYLISVNMLMHFYCLSYLYVQWEIDHKGKYLESYAM